MSALLNAVLKAAQTGRLQTTDGTSTPNNFSSGIPYESDGTVAIDLSGAISNGYMGLPYTAEGRIAATTDSVDHYGSGAAPFGAGGKLCIEDAAVDHYAHGVGYTAAGNLSITGRVIDVSSEELSLTGETPIKQLSFVEMPTGELGLSGKIPTIQRTG